MHPCGCSSPITDSNGSTLVLVERLCNCLVTCSKDSSHPAARYGHLVRALSSRLLAQSNSVSTSPSITSRAAHGQFFRRLRAELFLPIFRRALPKAHQIHGHPGQQQHKLIKKSGMVLSLCRTHCWDNRRHFHPYTPAAP